MTPDPTVDNPRWTVLGHTAPDEPALVLDPGPTVRLRLWRPGDPPPCAACNHHKADHCPEDGCLDQFGTADECVCAMYVERIHRCQHCGRLFGQHERWRLQVHEILQTCLRRGLAAAGRYAEPVDNTPPLQRRSDR